MRDNTDDGDEDFARDLLASSYGDMLQDVDRNEKYDAAIVRAIDRHVEKHGTSPHVLDIGTGTGLLAMMAARAGVCMMHVIHMFFIQTMDILLLIFETFSCREINFIPYLGLASGQYFTTCAV